MILRRAALVGGAQGEEAGPAAVTLQAPPPSAPRCKSAETCLHQHHLWLEEALPPIDGGIWRTHQSYLDVSNSGYFSEHQKPGFWKDEERALDRKDPTQAPTAVGGGVEQGEAKWMQGRQLSNKCDFFRGWSGGARLL